MRIRLIELLPWSAAPLTALLLLNAYRLPGLTIDVLIGALIFGIIVVATARAPIGAMAAIIVILPFENLVLSLLYRFGAPAALLDRAGSWKEAVLLALALAAFQAHRRQGLTLDRLDRVALAYLGLGTAYVAFPTLFTGSALDFEVRLVGARASMGFVVLLLAARRLGDAETARRLIRFVIAVATIVSAFGVFEFFASSSWNTLMIEQFEFPAFARDVLDARLRDPRDLRVYSIVAGQRVLRLSTVFFDPLGTGFYLVLPFVVLCERIAVGRARAQTLLALSSIGVTLLLTQTRSAIGAGALGAIIALRPHSQRATRGRMQLGALVISGVLVLLPLIVSSGLAERISGAVSGEEESAQVHRESFSTAVERALEFPLGEGFGRAGAAAVRFNTANSVVAENYYLQVANETGILAMVLFVFVTVLAVKAAGRTARSDSTALSVRSALIGLAVGGWFLHVWSDLAVSWPLWTLVGLVSGPLLLRPEPGIPTPATVGAA